MPDPRSVMKEFRFLDQKRQAQGLTADEETRYGELRDLVGGETGAAAKPGFNVSAAAARLRESLLPAGLRNRPPPAPEPSPEPLGEIEPPPEEPPAQAAYEQPYAAPVEEQALAADSLFDPGSLAEDGAGAYAYDPNAAAYDPNAAAAYDPNAAAYDPNAAAYDPNAAAYDPNAAAYDPNAAAYDPNAAAYDPNAAAYDPNAAAYDPNAAAYDPNAAAYDPNAAAAYDPNAAAAYDPNAAAAYDPNAAAYDPNAAAAYDPNAAAAYDPNAAAAYDPNATAAYDPNAAAAYDPNAAAYDPNAAAYDPNAAATSAEPDWGAVAADSASAEAAQAGEQPAWAPAPDAEYDGASWDAEFADPGAIPAPAEHAATPPPGPLDFGGYDDAAEPGAVGAAPSPDLEALLPFDPAAEARVGPEMAEAFGGDAMELPGGNDLVAQDEFHATESLTAQDAPGWQPEPGAVDQGFELASGGSFDASADAAAPEWAAPAAAATGSPWDAPAPGEDLAADDGYGSSPVPDSSAAASLDFSSPELTSESDDGGDLSWAGSPATSAGGYAGGGLELAEQPEAASAPLALDAPEELAVPAPLELGGSAEADAPFLELGAPAALDAELGAEEIPTIDGDAIIEEVSAEVVEAVEEAAPAYAHAAFEPAAYEPAAYEPPAPAYEAAPEPAVPAAHEADLPLEVIDATEPEVLDPGLPAADFYVHGAHRVVVHTVEGQVKRGFIENADLAAQDLDLAATQGGPAEAVPTAHVKAIFFMLAPGEQPAAPHGSRVRVTFRDGRQVAGFSPDYNESAFGFYMIPADARTSTGRIWVYQAAVKQVSVS